MDRVMVFGFLSGFFTLVLLGYRRELRTRMPVIPVSLACCAIYGFLQGAWPLGFCLTAVTASECRQWWVMHRPIQSHSRRADRAVLALEPESRLSRMFGAT